MKLIKFTTFLLSFLFLSSCNESRDIISAEKIESHYASGVVFILTQYTFTMTMENGAKFYFTRFDENGNLDLTMNESERPSAMASGTGFFVSADGQIATNSHVAFPSIDEKAVLAYLHSASNSLKDKISADVQALSDLINAFQSAALQADNSSEREDILTKMQEYEQARNKARQLLNEFDKMSHSPGHLTSDVMLGIAYNNTFVDKYSDLIPCVQVRHSKKHDVALIQLKSKQTPEKCHIFDVEVPSTVTGVAMPDENCQPIDVDNLTVGTHLYMIGFNKGLDIGSTKEGIKAQVTSGNLSQLVDDIDIMYTIPSLQGSSGSPVINDYGDLIAVNHAGWARTQNFNYGIRVKHLRNLMYQK